MENILCIIPARSGSKGIIDKNIKNYKGKPLFAWSIEQAKQSKYNMRIIVTTDSEKYACIANKYGAETPFLRPINIALDNSLDIDFIRHCVEWLEINEKYKPNIILQLRPTSPERKVEDINKALDIFIKNIDKYDSLRSVIKFSKSPYKMYNIIDDNLYPLFKSVNNITEPYNNLRQNLPDTYIHNGYIDILNVNILKKNTISGDRILPYVMSDDDNIDIDYCEDWKY